MEDTEADKLYVIARPNNGRWEYYKYTENSFVPNLCQASTYPSPVDAKQPAEMLCDPTVSILTLYATVAEIISVDYWSADKQRKGGIWL